jgi:hypothetical protein
MEYEGLVKSETFALKDSYRLLLIRFRYWKQYRSSCHLKNLRYKSCQVTSIPKGSESEPELGPEEWAGYWLPIPKEKPFEVQIRFGSFVRSFVRSEFNFFNFFTRVDLSVDVPQSIFSLLEV